MDEKIKNISLKKNLGWQTVYQVVATCAPLITSPYLSRVLGADGLGKYSFSYSVILVFTMLAMLGIANYGTREISKTRMNRQLYSKRFSEIYTIQIISSFSVLILYLLITVKSNNVLLKIQGLWVINCFIDINWLYSGLELFETTAIRSLIIKVLNISMIFLFVHDVSDLKNYTLIMAGSGVLGNVILCIGLRNRVSFVKIKLSDAFKHIKQILILFIPVAAASIFHLMDKVMLGMTSTTAESGYYFNADRLVNIPIMIVNGLCTVMLSRMSSISDDSEFKKIYNTYSELIYFTGIAMAFGIAAVAQEFVPIFFGNGYEKCIDLTYIFAMVMIAKTLSNTTLSMYLIPKRYDTVYLKAVITGAIVNFSCNSVLLISMKMGALGATIGTLVAEWVVCIMQYSQIKENFEIKNLIKRIVPYVIVGIFMFASIRIIATADLNQNIKLIYEILGGGAIYLIAIGIYWKLSKDNFIKKLFK